MRVRPTNLVLKGSSSEPDDDDVPPHSAPVAPVVLNHKRTAAQAGLPSGEKLDAKRQNLGLATPVQSVFANAGEQMVTPGQAILPPVNH